MGAGSYLQFSLTSQDLTLVLIRCCHCSGHHVERRISHDKMLFIQSTRRTLIVIDLFKFLLFFYINRFILNQERHVWKRLKI